MIFRCTLLSLMGAEGFFIDEIDGRVMGRVFGEKDNGLAKHGNIPDRDDKTWVCPRGKRGRRSFQRRRKALVGIRFFLFRYRP